MYKTLLWIIPAYTQKYLIEHTDLENLYELAFKYGYTTEFIFLTNDKHYNDCKAKIYTNVKYSIKIYDKKVLPNTAIMKQLENANTDNVMITSIIYTNDLILMEEMLKKSTISNCDFVRVKRKRLGIWGEITTLTKGLYNKVVKMFTNSKDDMYIRNCIIFNNLVLEIMKDYPNKSSMIRETSNLAGTNTEIIEIGKEFKTEKLEINAIWQVVTTIILWLVSLSLFYIICSVKMNLDTFIWLLIGLIVIVVVSVMYSNYAVLQNKIKIANFSLEQTKTLQPLKSETYNSDFVDERVLQIIEEEKKKKEKPIKQPKSTKAEKSKTTKTKKTTTKKTNTKEKETTKTKSKTTKQKVKGD